MPSSSDDTSIGSEVAPHRRERESSPGAAPTDEERSLRRGPIGWMANNPVAANLLMFVALVGGAIGLLTSKQEVFPEFDLDIVTVRVPYPGASPAEVEQGIVFAVEEAVRGLDGVKRVSSVAAQSIGTVTVELLLGADADKVLADVKSAVDRIVSFPEEAEKPVVSLASRRRQVISLVISGEQPEAILHELAEKARGELIALPEITQVDIEGVRPLEVSIEVPRQTLESLGLTLEQVAAQVRMASIEMPGGEIETRGGELMVRVADRRKSGAELRDIVLRGTDKGYAIRLGDIATIRDGFADTDQAYRFNGKPAVRVTAYRVADETPKSVAMAVRDYADGLRAEIPDNIELSVWRDDSELLAARIDLLVRNARIGFLLVVLVLALFLDLRLAGWVALGIPISFLGAFMFMPAADLSINMVTLFALIVTLGMVVDDAIVVGEAIYKRVEAGEPRFRAAVLGTREMVMPITFAILTSIAAFAPLFFVPGVMGKIFGLIPAVVCIVLAISLVECFFVLPAHLGHGRPFNPKGTFEVVHRAQRRVALTLGAYFDRLYRPSLEAALRLRYVVLSAAIASLLIAMSLIKAGVVPFSFFPKLEGDFVSATARLPYGAPTARTVEVQEALEEAAREAAKELGGESIWRGMFTRLGEGSASRGHGGAVASTGSHLVSVEINLVPSDQRQFTSAQFGHAWQRNMPEVAGVDSLMFNHSVGPGAGAAVDVQLSHGDESILGRASEELAAVLRGYDSLTNVSNGYAVGKPQIDYHLRPQASTLGLTGMDVARQIRSAFYGAEALREQRGRNEVKVMVRLPEAQRTSEYDLQALRINTPTGGSVPLGYVADFVRGRAPTAINREDGKRVVNVSAELAAGVRSNREVKRALLGDVLPALTARYAGLETALVGEQREQSESGRALALSYILAMLVVYGLLAIPFRSYTQPLLIMAAIPFGIVGAILGHLIMGYGLSIISTFGIVALSGVVVNDSLVLVDATNRSRRQGKSAFESIVAGATGRLRPIMLTSLTTFFGLAPMILETSVQARFLIPMAISLGFGVLFATLIVLLLVPSLYMILEDALVLFGVSSRGSRGERDAVFADADQERIRLQAQTEASTPTVSASKQAMRV